MKEFIEKNFKNKDDAVEYTKKNIEELALNMTNASEDVIRAYAEFKGIPIDIKAIDTYSYMEHEDDILYVLTAIRTCQEYLSEIESRLNHYYRPEDYVLNRSEEIERDFKSHLIDYVDEFSPDVDVKYPKDDSLSTCLKDGYMLIDDGKTKQVRNFL